MSDEPGPEENSSTSRPLSITALGFITASIAGLLLLLVVFSLFTLAETKSPGLWDDLGALGSLLAAVVGLVAMVFQVLRGQRTDEVRAARESQLVQEALAATRDLLDMTSELSSGDLGKEDVDKGEAEAVVRNLESRLGPEHWAARRLQSAYEAFTRAAAEAKAGTTP